jgi:hypothetical protein
VQGAVDVELAPGFSEHARPRPTLVADARSIPKSGPRLLGSPGSELNEG